VTTASHGSVTFRSSLHDDRAVVAAWVSACLDGTTVVDELEPDASDVALLIVDVAPVTDRRPDRDLPVRIRLTYCIVPPATVDGAAMVVDLLVASLEAADMDVVDAEVPVEWWQARGLVPRPVVRVQTVLVLDRPETERAQRVIEPLVVEIAPSGALRGTVLDDHGLPLAGAVVRLVATGARCETDRKGAFALASVGLERRHDITVAARGTTFAGSIPAGAPRDIHVHCTPASE
jgi:hypothetical protein